MTYILVPSDPNDPDCYYMECLLTAPDNIPYSLVKSEYNSDWLGYLVLDKTLQCFMTENNIQYSLTDYKDKTDYTFRYIVFENKSDAVLFKLTFSGDS
jgi:hypothetical protein